MIDQRAVVDPKAKLDPSVEVGPYAIIGPNVEIGAGTTVGPHAVIDGWTRIGKNCRIFHHASVGSIPQDLKYRGEPTTLEVGDGTMIREFATLNLGTVGGGGKTVVGKNCLLMSYSHVAHDCIVGDNVIMANSATLAGHVTVDDFVIIGGLSAVHQFVRLGEHSIIGGCSAVAQDVPPFVTASGNRAKLYGLNLVGLKRREFTEETVKALKKVYRTIFQTSKGLADTLEKLRNSEEYANPEVRKLVDFVAGSERGVTR